MPRRKMRGSGITRHEVIEWGPEEGEAFYRELDRYGYICPSSDFIRWLEAEETRIAKALEHFGLPAPGRTVCYAKDNPRDWQYSKVPSGPTTHTHARTEWHLQAFPYQSSFWYFGQILYRIHCCRLNLMAKRWLQLAGSAMELGRVLREKELKFSAEVRIATYERRQVAGSNKGNRTRRDRASAWQSLARKIVVANPDIDPHNRSAAATAILAKWPDAHSKPSHSSLRRYLSDWQYGTCCQE